MRTFLILLTLLLITTTKLSACTCAEENNSFRKKVKTKFLSSDVIFTGTVLSRKELSNTSKKVFGSPVRFTFKISEMIKGKLQHSQIDIITNSDEPSCGYEFEVGKTYLVYSRQSDYYTHVTKSKSDFITGLCARNQKLKDTRKKELRILSNMARSGK
ncbi:hypothetical protein [Marixanthomonas ophiurae]|uniref:Tissue inhibitor of metalloproteinase n=1 Tax=Marixanthomonas ophiurae TaxID=387659 RepID=A0A3E1Q7R3_9FLAO|nr:hypothetical protein [Marixanthomonas ophiurae]RFN58171.1 hypothetical protein DZ858_13135 [Marixanthomonas ophiurae]